MELQWRHFINLHKILTPFVVLGFMHIYNITTFGASMYLAMHGTYCMCWLLKDKWYPDKSFQKQTSIPMFVFYFLYLAFYWVAPFIICRNNHIPTNIEVTVSLTAFTFGMFFHYGSDAQKYFTLKARRGLITDGFFSLTRNPNYFGETLTYIGLMSLSGSYIPFVCLLTIAISVFYPNMKKKDQSLWKYEEFKEYKSKTGMFIPKIW